MWRITLPPAAFKPHSSRRGSFSAVRVWKIVWQSGGPWGRFFVAWFLGGTAFALFVGIGARVWLDYPSGEWRRFALVAGAVIATYLPTIWAIESASTLRKLVEAGLEHAGLAQMKIDYLSRFGKHGGCPVARFWAVLYILLYALWLLIGLWVLPILGVRDLLMVSLIDGAFVFGLMIIVTMRARAYYRLAELRGFPITRLAMDLKNQGVRS